MFVHVRLEWGGYTIDAIYFMPYAFIFVEAHTAAIELLVSTSQWLYVLVQTVTMVGSDVRILCTHVRFEHQKKCLHIHEQLDFSTKCSLRHRKSQISFPFLSRSGPLPAALFE